MSRILRRPMFRGGSINEGIMSVPRKGYADINQDGVQNDDTSLLDSGTITTTPTGITVSDDSGVDLSKINRLGKEAIQTKNPISNKLGNISAMDALTAEYLGERPDPLGKFLINFGLNYMSARPKGGRFGALATAAEAAKKPTEQLYTDIDTDRLLKLKLLGVLGKSESSIADIKRAKALAENRDAPNSPYKGLSYEEAYSRAINDIQKGNIEQKKKSIEARISDRADYLEKENKAPDRRTAEAMATFDLEGIKKIPKEHSQELASGKYFLPSNALIKKPNSEDYAISPTGVKNFEATIGKMEEKKGKNFVDPITQTVYLYVGNNTFRPISRY